MTNTSRFVWEPQDIEWLNPMESKQYETTAMVAFDVSDDPDLKALQAEAGFEPVKLLHITLVYLGDVVEQKLSYQDLEHILESFASTHAPISGKYNGLAVFEANAENDNLAPLVALFDSPELPAFRQALLHRLEGCGCAEQNHGFTPHTTLAYVKPDELGVLPEAPSISKTFDKIGLYWGQITKFFPLSGTIVEKGGPGSGNFHHGGRPGQVGGSSPFDTVVDTADKLQDSYGYNAYFITPEGKLLDVYAGGYKGHAEYMARHASSMGLTEQEAADIVDEGGWPKDAARRWHALDKVTQAGYVRVAVTPTDLNIEMSHVDTAALRQVKRWVDDNKLPYRDKVVLSAVRPGQPSIYAKTPDLLNAKYIVDGELKEFIVEKGLPIDDASKARLIQARMDIFDTDMDNLANQVYSGQISLGQWEENMKGLIKGLHASTAAIGKGGWDEMTQSDWGRVGAEVKKQYRYLHNFAENIAENRDSISLKAIQARAHMYGDAAGHTAGIMQAGEFSGGTTRNPTEWALPWLPKDGSTECLVNCKCKWISDIVDQTKDWKLVQFTWTLFPAEHCHDCVERSGHAEIFRVPADTYVPPEIGGW